MHSEASQQGPRMVSGGMPKGRTRVTTSPSQNRSTVNDQVTCSDESGSNSMDNREHKEGFVEGCSGSVATFALLRFTGNVDTSLFISWQATSQGQSRPAFEPVVHVLIR